MIILASKSLTRQNLLKNAGVAFDTMNAQIDEHAIKEALVVEGVSPRDIADTLAEMKSLKASRKINEVLCLGADQILEFEGRVLNKCDTPEALAEQLLALSGKVHKLWAVAVISKDGTPIWRHVSGVQVQFRALSPEFIKNYINANFDEIRHSVGGYQIESMGSQLISAYKGDYFAVLGLPLLEILDILRQHKELPI